MLSRCGSGALTFYTAIVCTSLFVVLKSDILALRSIFRATLLEAAWPPKPEAPVVSAVGHLPQQADWQLQQAHGGSVPPASQGDRRPAPQPRADERAALGAGAPPGDAAGSPAVPRSPVADSSHESLAPSAAPPTGAGWVPFPGAAPVHLPEPSYDWSNVLRQLFQHHESSGWLRFSRADVLKARRASWKTSILVAIKGNEVGITRPPRLLPHHVERVSNLRRLLEYTATRCRLPDTTFMMVIEDCDNWDRSRRPNTRFPKELMGVLHFALVYSEYENRTGLPLPITMGERFLTPLWPPDIEAAAKRLVYNATQVYPWERRINKAVFRGNYHAAPAANPGPRDKVFQAGRLAPQYIDAIEHNFTLSRHDKLMKYKHQIYAGGFCRWSSSIYYQILGDAVLFSNKRKVNGWQFLQFDLVPGEDYIEFDDDPKDIVRVVKESLGNQALVAKVRRQLAVKARAMMTANSITNFVARVLWKYHSHMVPDVHGGRR